MQMQNWTLTNHSAVRAGFGGRWRTSLLRATIGLADALLAWQTRARERAQLAALDDRLLHDMGLTRADVLRESAKPFWTR